MQKIKKILSAISEKTALPTNQPTNQAIVTNNTNLIEPCLRRSKKTGPKMDLCGTPIFAVS